MTISDARQRAAALQLHGVLAHWAECANQPWFEPLLAWEETERARRSLERRLRCAHIGRFSRSPISTGPGRSSATRAPSPS